MAERKIKISKIREALIETKEHYKHFERNWIDSAIEELAEKFNIKLD